MENLDSITLYLLHEHPHLVSSTYILACGNKCSMVRAKCVNDDGCVCVCGNQFLSFQKKHFYRHSIRSKVYVLRKERPKKKIKRKRYLNVKVSQ